MRGFLFDTSVWLAVVFPTHPFHDRAKQFLQKAAPGQPALFCRFTQQSFLRLVSTPALHNAYGANGMTNRDALLAMDSLQALPQVAVCDEPPGVVSLWFSLATQDAASPKVWTDAYLAAFAKVAGLRLVTFDRDFQNFVPFGLDLAWIQA